MTDGSATDYYRTLFANNVAGVALSTPAGQIVDCNDAFTETFGFASRAEVLAQSAWNYYLDRQDRDRVIQLDTVTENHAPQELRFRHKNGRPIWLRFTRVVVSSTRGRPELMVVTAMDVTQLKRLKAQIRELSIMDVTCSKAAGESSVRDLIDELASHLQVLNLTLRPENLENINRECLRQFIRSVERMKVVISALLMNQVNSDESTE